MKELSIEQKAKRYDEAKYIMKEYLESGNAGVIAENTIRKAFPELVEPEDERIRKDIVTYLKSILSNKKYGDKFIESWIAWLEAKGERKHADSYCQENCKGFQETGKCFADGECKAKREAEQKTVWSEEDEEILKDIITDVKFEGYNNDMQANSYKKINWLKKLKDRVYPKQEWKQENTDDLTDFENAMMHIGGSFFGENAGLDPNDTNAIKEQANILLELVPKQKWSEEDEYHKRQILRILKDNGCSQTLQKKTEKWIEEKLKSLKHRSQWKPSDEQMGVIEAVINNRSFQRRHLDSLYNDLKKLKGE